MNDATTPTALGAYIFAGAFTVGVSEYFEVVAHFEGDAYGNKTFKLNYPHVPSYWPPEEWPVADYAGKVDFLYANPPCAPWSQVGASLNTKNAQNWRTDPRTDCFRQCIRTGIDLGTEAIAVESVTNSMARGWDFVAEQARILMNAGYEVTFVRHDSVFWGLPQRRRRVFLVGTKFHVEWPHPPNILLPAREALKEVKELGLVKTLEGKYLPLWEILALQTEGKKSLRKVYLDTYKTNKGSPRLATHMVNIDGPVSTIIGLTQIHPEEPRYFSENELKRLNGVPDWFQFHHPENRKHVLSAIASEVARGVNPVIASWLAKVVRDHMRAGVPAKRPSVRIVDFMAKGRKDMTPRCTEEDVTELVLNGS